MNIKYFVHLHLLKLSERCSTEHYFNNITHKYEPRRRENFDFYLRHFIIFSFGWLFFFFLYNDNIIQ